MSTAVGPADAPAASPRRSPLGPRCLLLQTFSENIESMTNENCRKENGEEQKS